MFNLPTLFQLIALSPTMALGSDTKSCSPFDSLLQLRLSLSRQARTSGRQYNSEALGITHLLALHLTRASTLVPAFRALPRPSIIHASWAAPIARFEPTSGQLLTGLSIASVVSELLCLSALSVRRLRRLHLPFSNLLRSTRRSRALQYSAAIHSLPI